MFGNKRISEELEDLGVEIDAIRGSIQRLESQMKTITDILLDLEKGVKNPLRGVEKTPKQRDNSFISDRSSFEFNVEEDFYPNEDYKEKGQ